MTPETKLSKVRGVTVALICLVPLGVAAIVVLLWHTVCVPVIGAFAELGRDLKALRNGDG